MVATEPVTRTAPERPGTPGAAVAVGAGAVLALLTGLAVAAATGATAALPLIDPGPVVRWGLIAAGALRDVSAALTVGLLVLAAVALPPARAAKRDGEGPGPGAAAHRRAMTAAAVSATTWAAATLLLMVFQYADVSGRPMSDPQFGAEVLSYARTLPEGQGYSFTLVVAAVIGLVAAGTSGYRAAGLLSVLAFAALVPPALSGHVAGASDHETAVTALGLHLYGACIWAGALAALLVLAPVLSHDATAAAARRFSTLAGWAFAAVVLSGVLSAWLRIGHLSGLASDYGAVLVAKTVALVALGAAGWQHRRSTLAALADRRPHAFARLAAAEVALMGVAFGLGAALSRTPPPATGDVPPPADAAQSITGYPMPDAPTAGSWLTAWQPDLLWLLLAGAGAGLYLLGVRRLRGRGDRWPVHRTLLWLAGLAVLVYVTCGAPAVYGRVTFSWHMLMHMIISMVAPAMLVLGAPVTLALRTLPARRDGSRGAREWTLAVLASPVTRVLTFAPVAAAIFAGSLVVFYYSDLFELALTTHVGHELMMVHFLLAGYLFASVLVGTDPLPHRPGYPQRLLLLFATMAFHAFFAVSLLMGTAVLQERFFGALGRTWGRDLLEDQHYGGGLAFGVGEIPTLLLAVVLAVQWSRSDDREAKRRDRAADRDGDAELVAYNAMLTHLADRDATLDR